jgi:biopolymer transport protein ExbD
MAAQLGGNDDEPIAAINVVPLVDIILVVLIIFMVTAPLVLKPSIDINLPKASTGDESPQTPLNITVARDGSLLLNGKISTLEDITVFVTNLLKSQPETAAILAADKDVTLERLTQIIDIVKSAGVKRVAFSIEKK